MPPIVLKILILAGIILVPLALFIISYLLNKKTPRPEGCENLSGGCDGCQILSCTHRIEEKSKNEKGDNV